MQAVEGTMTRAPARTPGLAPATGAAAEVALLFRAHASFVYRALGRLNVPAADLDDALQEVFLVVARKLDQYEDRGAIRAWLFAIARQVALHARRSEGRSEARRARAALAAEVPRSSDPELDLQRRQAAEVVRGMLAQLDPDQAMVFYLAEIEGFTVPEIAASLEVNLNTVYGRLRLARKRIEGWVRDQDFSTENR